MFSAPWVFAISVFAQEAESDIPPSELVSPPQLVHFVEAVYPESEKDLGVEATVGLELMIGADGKVSEVKVIESASEAFDRSAEVAVRQFIFEPAQRNGKPVPSRVGYRYVFELKHDKAEETTGWLSGLVLLAKDETPSPGRTIEVRSEETNEVWKAESEEEGSFIVTDLPPGKYRVTVFGGELGEVVNVEEISEGMVTEVTYRLGALRKQGEVVEGFGVTAVLESAPREVVKRTIGKDELTRIPGTRGDALRAIEILPGVGRPPVGLGLLIIRGSAPQDSETFIEGIPVPILYHFGGVTSVINSRLLEQIDFVPGNFSSRYGRRTGGIVDVKTRDPKLDSWHGIAEGSFIDAYVLAEGPIRENLGIALAARRSLIDLLLPVFAPDDIGIIAPPVYYDYQLFLTWKPTINDRVRFLTYGSSDRFEVLLDDVDSDDPAIRGNTGLVSRFNFLQFDWERKLKPNIEQKIDLMTGPIRLDLQVSDNFSLNGNFYQTYGRGEWKIQVRDWVSLTAGLDLFLTVANLQYIGPQPTVSEGGGSQQGSFAGRPTVFAETLQTVVRPGAYLESSMELGDFTTLVLMTRFDYFSELRKYVIDPRATAVFQVRDDMRVSLGLGLYSQPPEFQESDRTIGNPDLDPIRSVHVGAGYEIDPFPGMRFSVEGFYKHLWRRVIADPDGRAPFFINGGIGRIYGAEFAAHIRPTEGKGEGERRYFGYLSYTLSRSERRDSPDEPWRLFDFDQTHILTASFVYRFPRNWEIGGTFRLVSGNPDTPVVGSVYDALNDIYVPIDGPLNSLRNPLFHRFDLRIEKQWIFNPWKLALFLDIQNLYNRRNQEGILYNFDFSQQTIFSGLPLIPSLGLRGEL